MIWTLNAHVDAGAVIHAGALVVWYYKRWIVTQPSQPQPPWRLGWPWRQAGRLQGMWIMGTFLMLLVCVAWSLWMVLQVIALTNKGYHAHCRLTRTKLLATLIQSCAVAVAIFSYF